MTKSSGLTSDAMDTIKSGWTPIKNSWRTSQKSAVCHRYKKRAIVCLRNIRFHSAGCPIITYIMAIEKFRCHTHRCWNVFKTSVYLHGILSIRLPSFSVRPSALIKLKSSQFQILKRLTIDDIYLRCKCLMSGRIITTEIRLYKNI